MARTPRLDPYERLIYRFFEAVYLLSLLGSTRGPHVASIFDPFSLVGIRRRFLKSLAFLCDGVKGGSSTASIAVQDSPEHYIFWVSSNQGPTARVLGLLRSVLESVKSFVKSSKDDRIDIENDLICRCIHFSSRRVRSQAHSLVNCAERCRGYLLSNSTDDPDASLVTWLLQFRDVDFEEGSLHEVCRMAYRVRNDPEMQKMEKLGGRFHNLTQAEDISTAFFKVRHIIGRLAAHIRSVKQLLDDGIHLDDLLEAYEVSAVPVPPSVPLPEADGHTNLFSILKRFFSLGAKDPRFESTLNYLSRINQQAQLEDRLRGCHGPERKTPTVHAEVQMLHHFHDNRYAFAWADRYIATSKPACMCCKLYFRHHPAMYVEPDSHQRVWPSWRPILLPLGQAEPSWAEQLEVLNSVCRDVRREVIMVVEQRQAISFAHPDSLTGVTYLGDDGFSESDDERLDSEGSGAEVQWDDDNQERLWEEDHEDLESDTELEGGARL